MDQEPLTTEPPASRRTGFRLSLKTAFLTGIVVTAPIGLTLYLVWSFVSAIDDLVKPLIPPAYSPEAYLEIAIPGLGVVIAILFLTLIGFVTANVLGRTLVRIGERIVARMPIVRSIYGALKQLFETVLSQSSRSFREVVLVEYPRAGAWSIAFVTADTVSAVRAATAEDAVTIYVPTTPNPTSGFLLFVPRRDLITLDMTVDEGFKFLISGGIVAPPDRAALPPKRPTLFAQR
jgi:uncharacterized membrane protein